MMTNTSVVRRGAGSAGRQSPCLSVRRGAGKAAGSAVERRARGWSLARSEMMIRVINDFVYFQ